jgi:hypothetical protein
MDLVAPVAVRLAAFLACLAIFGGERFLTDFFLSAPFLLVAREDADFFDADFLPPFFAGIVLLLLLDHSVLPSFSVGDWSSTPTYKISWSLF